MKRTEKLKWLLENIGSQVKTRVKRKFLWLVPFWGSSGWFTIERKSYKPTWNVMLTNGKETHDRSFGARAYMVFLKEDDSLDADGWGATGVMETAIWFHWVYEEDEIKEIEAFVKKLIDETYEYYVNKKK